MRECELGIWMEETGRSPSFFLINIYLCFQVLKRNLNQDGHVVKGDLLNETQQPRQPNRSVQQG
jgi:hypothetical protein